MPRALEGRVGLCRGVLRGAKLDLAGDSLGCRVDFCWRILQGAMLDLAGGSSGCKVIPCKVLHAELDSVDYSRIQSWTLEFIIWPVILFGSGEGGVTSTPGSQAGELVLALSLIREGG